MKVKTPRHFDTQIITQYVNNRLLASTLLMITTLQDLENKETIPDFLIESKELKKIKSFIVDTYTGLDQIFDSQGSEQALQQILEYKNKIKDIGLCVYSYYHACNITEELFEYHFQLSAIIEDAAEIKESSAVCLALVKRCMDYIYADDSPGSHNTRKAEILSRVPLRMTKLKYADYISSSLKKMMNGLSAEDCDKVLKLLRVKFNPFQCNEYGRYFDVMGQKLNDWFNTDFSGMNKHDFETGDGFLDDISGEIDDTVLYLDMLMECINFLTIILSFGSNVDTVLQDNILYKDIYYSFREHYRTDFFELIKEQLIENTYKFVEDILDDCIELEQAIEKMLRHTRNDLLPEEEQKFLEAYFLVKEVYSDDLMNLCFPSVNTLQGKQEDLEEAAVNAMIDEFAAELNIADMEVKKQRLIKQFFMASIPCFMEDEEYEEHIMDAFNSASKAVQVLVFSLLDEVVGGNELYDSNEEMPHEPHHHHDGCGCGHDH